VDFEIIRICRDFYIRVGQVISELSGINVVEGPTVIGLGIGLLAAVVYMIRQKK